MNLKQLSILLVLVIIIGFGGLQYCKHNQAGWSGAKEGQKLLPDLPVGESLSRIAIEQGTNTLTLVKQDDLWRVTDRGNYPANYSEISSIVLKLRDLKVAQTEQIGASQLGRLELLPPGPGSNTATQIEFKDDSGKTLATLQLGKQQMRKENRPSPYGGGDMEFPVGRWVMTGAKDRVMLVSDTLDGLKADAGNWLNKDFLHVEKIKSISVQYPDTTNSWSVSRDTDTANEWHLADAKPEEKLDSSKTSGFSWALSSPSFDDVLMDSDLSRLGLDKPTVIKIETFDGFHYTIKAGEKMDSHIPITVVTTADYPRERKPDADEKAEDKAKLDKEFTDDLKKLDEKLAAAKALEKWTYSVSSWTLDSLLKTRFELLETKKEESKESDTEHDSAEGASSDSHQHEHSE